MSNHQFVGWLIAVNIKYSGETRRKVRSCGMRHNFLDIHENGFDRVATPRVIQAQSGVSSEKKKREREEKQGGTRVAAKESE